MTNKYAITNSYNTIIIKGEHLSENSLNITIPSYNQIVRGIHEIFPIDTSFFNLNPLSF
jgi:hypothetical protein